MELKKKGGTMRQHGAITKTFVSEDHFRFSLD